MMIWYMYGVWLLTFDTAALVPRSVCSSLRSPVSCQQWKKICVPSRPVVKTKNVPPVPYKKKKRYRPFPSWNKLYTVPSRRENLSAPSRPVEQKNTYRPVPSWQFLLTVPSRRDNFYFPAGPLMKQKGHCSLPSRSVEKVHTHRPVLSHAGKYNFQSFPVPFRPVFNLSPAKHFKTVPSRPRILPAMKSLGFFPTRHRPLFIPWCIQGHLFI